MAWTDDGTLWTVVNERDELGSDLVPDYLTSVKDGGFYGWPYSWYGSHVDPRVTPPRPDLVAQAIAPDYALGAHVAPLGLAAATPSPLTAALTVAGAPSAPIAAPAATAASALASSAPTAATPPVHGMFVGLHGSWNREPLSGYKVVYVVFEGDKPIGLPRDVLTGFVTAEGNALGRPVGVAIDGHGALLVADDVGNVVWRVMPR
jgi:glucose/arabinose dehydrogenase